MIRLDFQYIIPFETTDAGSRVAADATPTAVLYRNGSASGVSVTITTTAVTGLYHATFTTASNWNAEDRLWLDVAATIDSEARAGIVWDSFGETSLAAVTDSVWDEPLTGATHNVANSAGRRLRTLADTVVLNEGDVIAADNNGTINSENGLGRVTFASDVGTVCVGQAVRVSGQVRYVEAYDSPTQTATVDAPWCVIPTVGDEYTIFSQRSSLVMRINAAASGTIAFVIAKLWEMIEDVSGWRFNAKAVELASVTVLPATGTAAGRGDRSTLVVFVGETITTSITAYQADGVTPLDLSGKSLVMVFEDKAGNDVATIANANITVSGPSSNIVTFAYPSSVSQIERTLRWSLRDDAAPNTVYLLGLVEARRAAFVDPS